jgi:hypothetical protein
MMPTYPDFVTFAEAVQALHTANPDWMRLNGKLEGGDQNAWAFFTHNGKKWKVDADTHVLPILVAYQYFRKTGVDPFHEGNTQKRYKLVLNEEVESELVRQDADYEQHKRLYMYSDREK